MGARISSLPCFPHPNSQLVSNQQMYKLSMIFPTILMEYRKAVSWQGIKKISWIGMTRT
ncbi:hypothetical protein ACS0TY_032208 [Phlomoides rotata]